ncbi:MAG: hypothetical protein MUO37_09645, partial [Methyloceanibacter sp.]|nr:hypothetical protein [Methyloceanibacter sp.]
WPSRHCGRAATEQSLSSEPTNKEMPFHAGIALQALDRGPDATVAPKIPLSFDCHKRVIAPEIDW